MDSRLARMKELYTELLEQNKILSEQKGILSIENFELKRRVAKLEDTLAKVLNSADKFVESLFECRKTEMVDVVRCKDCKYYDKSIRLCDIGHSACDPDWFCADMRRSENDG